MSADSIVKELARLAREQRATEELPADPAETRQLERLLAAPPREILDRIVDRILPNEPGTSSHAAPASVGARAPVSLAAPASTSASTRHRPRRRWRTFGLGVGLVAPMALAAAGWLLWTG